ncbi:MAG: hypothetical protein H6736_12370 [Alphaproteobacteria bacterium]|nr:hypothetical protein [Alphaproteobacteria bacterium]MCB9692596.1 hypothetical protein [Alphaproteobacteria bacterium]
MSKRENSMVAVGLEVGPGVIFQTFGVGHLYQGRVAAGLGFMLSYWALQAVNGFLVSFGGLGFVTGFLTWLAYMVVAPTDVLRE